MKREQITVFIAKYMFMFMAASMIGWMYEIACVRILYNIYYDRGILHLPMCPIYGFGMLMLLVIFRKVRNPVGIFVGSTIFTTALELASSYILEYKFNMILWTYEDWPLSFQNRISAVSSCMFGLMALMVMKLIKPVTDKLFESEYKMRASMTVAVLFIFCVIWEVSFYG